MNTSSTSLKASLDQERIINLLYVLRTTQINASEMRKTPSLKALYNDDIIALIEKVKGVQMKILNKMPQKNEIKEELSKSPVSIYSNFIDYMSKIKDTKSINILMAVAMTLRYIEGKNKENFIKEIAEITQKH